MYNNELASFFCFPLGTRYEPLPWGRLTVRLSSPRNQQEVSFYHIREYPELSGVLPCYDAKNTCQEQCYGYNEGNGAQMTFGSGANANSKDKRSI